MNILDYIEMRMAEGYTEEEAMLLSDELWPIEQSGHSRLNGGAK